MLAAQMQNTFTANLILLRLVAIVLQTYRTVHTVCTTYIQVLVLLDTYLVHCASICT